MSSIGIFILVLGIWFCLFFAATSYYSYKTEQQRIQINLDERIPPWKVMKQTRSKTDLLHHWMDHFAPTGEKIEILSDPVELEDDLVKAGYPYGLTVKRVQGAKILGTFLGLGSGFLYWLIGLPLAPVIAIFLPFLGYMAPIYGVKFLAKRRQEQIRYELPDFLDMMSITLQAGMGLDEAFAYYVQTNKGPLSEELARLNQEIQFGVQRETAYRSLIRRTDSSELEALIQSLIQAHNLGTPIAKTFAQQAEEMRRMRAEQAKEAAGKAAPKISLVSGLVIAPSIMLLMLGAIVYSYFIERNIFGS
ncbi:type II secretion system F family protein [Kroppenstedtia sanguinis]|uniref:Type II secretion system F family protein n=1 Tax=Kroppenstedtia sanguinis TaxID=1380684 RepID=A0ABW4CDW7_9BACL